MRPRRILGGSTLANTQTFTGTRCLCFCLLGPRGYQIRRQHERYCAYCVCISDMHMEQAYQKFLSSTPTCVSGMHLGHDYQICTSKLFIGYAHYMHFRCACQKWISEKHDCYEHRCISVLTWHGKYDYLICISEMHAQNAFARCMPDIHIGFVYQITHWFSTSDMHIRPNAYAN